MNRLLELAENDTSEYGLKCNTSDHLSRTVAHPVGGTFVRDMIITVNKKEEENGDD